MEINEETLRKLQNSQTPDMKKVFNLIKSVDKYVKDGEQTPIKRYIGEMAERIAEQYRQRQIDTKEAIEQLKQIINEINTAKVEQEEKKMSSDVFSAYWILKNEKVADAESIAVKLDGVFRSYPHWKTSEAQEREVRREMYKVLTKASISNLPDFVNKMFRIMKGAAS